MLFKQLTSVVKLLCILLLTGKLSFCRNEEDFRPMDFMQQNEMDTENIPNQRFAQTVLRNEGPANEEYYRRMAAEMMHKQEFQHPPRREENFRRPNQNPEEQPQRPSMISTQFSNQPLNQEQGYRRAQNPNIPPSRLQMNARQHENMRSEVPQPPKAPAQQEEIPREQNEKKDDSKIPEQSLKTADPVKEEPEGITKDDVPITNNKKVIVQPKETLEPEIIDSESEEDKSLESKEVDNKTIVKTADKGQNKTPQLLHHKKLDPPTPQGLNDNTRNERTIGRLHEVQPLDLVRNFREKLQTARNNVEDMVSRSRTQSDPRIFIYDPNLPLIPRSPLKSLLPVHEPRILQRIVEDLTTKPESEQEIDSKKLITSPITDEEEAEPASATKHSDTAAEEQGAVPDVQNARQSEDTVKSNQEISQLLQVRDEINRIRHIMQLLKEHQLKQKFGQFPTNQNLTQEEQAELSQFVDQLKASGKISTSPLEDASLTGFQNDLSDPVDTNVLVEDIKKLKNSIQHYAKKIGAHPGDSTDVASLQRLEEQLQKQRKEIESIKLFIEEILPPVVFPSSSNSNVNIKTPDMEKMHLRDELKSLQEVLNDLLAKEDKLLDNIHMGKSRSTIDGEKQPDQEIGTLMKIFRSMGPHHQVSSGMDSESGAVLSKLEQIEREIQALDVQNQKARQQLMVEKLERQLKKLKASPRIQNEDEKPTPDPLEAQINGLEKQLKELSGPQNRQLEADHNNVQKELEKLHKDIQRLGVKPMKQEQPEMSSRQLQGLLSDILASNLDGQQDSTQNLPLVPQTIVSLHDGSPFSPSKAKMMNYPPPSVNHQASNFKKHESFPYAPPQPAYQPNKQSPMYQGPRVESTYPGYAPQTQEYQQPQSYQPHRPVVHPVYIPSKPEGYKGHQGGYQAKQEMAFKMTPCQHTAQMEEEIKKLNGMLSILNEKIDYSQDPEVPSNYGVAEDAYRKNNDKETNEKKRQKRSADDDEDRSKLIEEIRQKIHSLRDEVRSVSGDDVDASDKQRTAYYSGDSDQYQSYGGSKSKSFKLKKKQKFDDLFIKIVKFIIHKMEISTPLIVESLFNGDVFTEENNGYYEPDYNSGGYRSSYRGSEDDSFENEESTPPQVQNNGFGALLNSFQGFPGLLGLIPTILLRLLSNFSSLLTTLKRNNFFKNFLFPGGLILAVNGIMALLVAWFSPDDTQNFFNNNQQFGGYIHN